MHKNKIDTTYYFQSEYENYPIYWTMLAYNSFIKTIILTISNGYKFKILQLSDKLKLDKKEELVSFLNKNDLIYFYYFYSSSNWYLFIGYAENYDFEKINYKKIIIDMKEFLYLFTYNNYYDNINSGCVFSHSPIYMCSFENAIFECCYKNNFKYNVSDVFFDDFFFKKLPN